MEVGGIVEGKGRRRRSWGVAEGMGVIGVAEVGGHRGEERASRRSWVVGRWSSRRGVGVAEVLFCFCYHSTTLLAKGILGFFFNPKHVLVT